MTTAGTTIAPGAVTDAAAPVRHRASSTPSTERVVVADGAMGTMLQATRDLVLDDFRGPRGLQRDPQRHPARRRAQHPPRLLRGRRRRRGDQHLRGEPAQPGRLRHRRPDPRARREGRPAGPRGRRRDVHARPAALRARLGRPRHEAADAGPRSPSPACATPTPSAAAGCSPAAPTRSSIETCQDLLQVKAAVLGVQRAMVAEGRRIPIVAQVTVETTGTMLLGSEIGAALTALEPLGIDLIGLNCSTGPGRDERAPAHAVQARADPAVGDAQRRAARARARTARSTRSTPTSWPRRWPRSSATTALRLVGGCCGTTPGARQRGRRGGAAAAPAGAPPAPRAGPELAVRARCRSARTPRC